MSEIPAFRDVWGAARARARRRARRRRGLAATAAIGGALALLVLFSGPPPGTEPDPRALAALSRDLESWQGPLDFLLHTPGEEHLATIPEIGSAATLSLPREPLTEGTPL